MSIPTTTRSTAWLSSALLSLLLINGPDALAQAGVCNTGGCTGGISFGFAQAATTSATFISGPSGQQAGQFSTYGVVAGSVYEWSLCTADGAVSGTGDNQLTLRTTGGTILCYADDVCGLQAKILWTSNITGQVQVLINQFNCLTNTLSHTIRWRRVASGVTVSNCGNVNGSNPLNYNAPLLNQTVTTTCPVGTPEGWRASQHTIWNNVVAGASYRFTSSNATDFFTVRQGGSVNSWPLFAAGTTPLTWTPTASGSFHVSLNTSAACGTSTTCRIVTVERFLPACTNAIASSSSAIAPIPGQSSSIGCQFATEYSTWTGLTIGAPYTISSSITTDYITVRSGSFNGPVTAAGTVPLALVPTTSGTHFIHVNTNLSCGTSASCRTITMFRPCPAIGASAVVVNNCSNNTYNVNVTITDLAGTDAVDLIYTINGVSTTVPNVTSSHSIPNIAVSNEVSILLSSGLGGCAPTNLGTYSSNCPYTVSCSQPVIVGPYCYKNIDNKTWTFIPPTGSNLRVTFLAGTMQPGPDVIRIWGGSIGGTLLFSSNLPQLTGLQREAAVNQSLIIEVVATDGSGSCQDGTGGPNNPSPPPNQIVQPWVFEVECPPSCMDPSGFASITPANCSTNTFRVNVDVEDAGMANGIFNDYTTLQWYVNGALAGTIPNIMAFDPTIQLPPSPATGFALGQEVTVVLRNEGDADCDRIILLNQTQPALACFPNTPCLATQLPVALDCANTLVTLVGATASGVTPLPQCAPTTAGFSPVDVWYKVIVPPNGIVKARTSTSGPTGITDTGMAFYTGSTCNGTLNWLACNDDGGTAGAVGNFSSLTATGLLPGSTLYLRLWRFGNGALADGTFNICVFTDPPCMPPPTATAASAITANSANANFTIPATGPIGSTYIVEYGPASTFTTPGTAGTAGANGTVILNSSSPQPLIGLIGNTTYRYFVRRNCAASGDGFGPNSNAITFTTLPTPPDNDNCAQAFVIPVNNPDVCTQVISATLAGATASGPAACAGTANDDVWFTFTATAGLHRLQLLNVSPTTTMRVQFFTGTCGAPLATGICVSTASANVSGLTPGTPYLVRVHSFGSVPVTTNFNICISTPVLDCLGQPDGPAVPGSSCNDNNPCTINDVYQANCICAGTFQDADLDGVCDANDSCPLVPGQVGSACSDGDPCTVNDVLTANCQCVGQYLDTDNDGICDALDSCPLVPGQVNSPCNDGDPNTINDALGPDCICTGAPAFFDCNGVPNGPAVAGTPCSDGDPCTINDVFQLNCACLGTLQDSDNDGICDALDNCPQVPGVIGSPCDDGDPCTLNDALNANCACSGINQDSDGDGICDGLDNCPLVPGTIGSPCDDGLFYTINDALNADCICTGVPPAPPANDLCNNAISITCNSVVSGTTIGATTAGVPVSCGASGSLVAVGGVWYTVQGWNGLMTASLCNAGTLFDTRIAVFSGSCGALDCVAGNDNGGPAACNLNGVSLKSTVSWTASAGTTYYIYVTGTSLLHVGPFELFLTCASTGPVCNSQGLQLELTTDGNGSQNSWQIVKLSNGFIVCGGQNLPNNSTITSNCCLPNDCYDLRVYDSAGDGISGGGYVLRTMLTGQRIIDNSYNFLTGFTSTISGEQGFCVPIGTDRVIALHCDKVDWVNGATMQAVENPLVSSQWQVGDQTDDGYEFWIFDPNGSYSHRRFRSHAVTDGFGPPSALRATYVRLNNLPAVLQAPSLVLMNVRVRSRVNGLNAEWGPACRLVINPSAGSCPATSLNNQPGGEFSCGVQRSLNQIIYAKAVPAANLYEFRFRIPSENFVTVKQSTSTALQLNWTGPDALIIGATYNVEVRARKGQVWCVTGPLWGDICTVTIISPVQGGGSTNMAIEDVTGNLSLWPNPNNGQQLWLSLGQIDKDLTTVTMDVYDLTGKRVLARVLPVQDNGSNGGTINTDIDLGAKLSAGMYLVNVTAGDKVHTQRLVIQP